MEQGLQSTGGDATNKNDYQQSINGQNLSATPSNLQNSNSSLLSGNKNLSSVGSSQFIPVPKATSTTVVKASAPKTDFTPFVVGGLLFVIILTASFLISVYVNPEPAKEAVKKTTKNKSKNTK